MAKFVHAQLSTSCNALGARAPRASLRASALVLWRKGARSATREQFLWSFIVTCVLGRASLREGDVKTFARAA
eukprot:4288610-Alexandrium_andersonii.AAC.1